MTEDDSAQALLAELLRYPDLPADWQQRAAHMPYAQSFKIQRRVAAGRTETFIALNSTLGATPYVSRPRMILTALHPLQPEQWITQAELPDLHHPKLFTEYQ